MAFWDKWFAPDCTQCKQRILEDKVEFEDRLMHGACRDKLIEKRRIAKIEADERAEAQKIALAKLEGRQEFGSDPRYD